MTSARVPLVARWPVFLARGSDADGEPHYRIFHYNSITYDRVIMMKFVHQHVSYMCAVSGYMQCSPPLKNCVFFIFFFTVRVALR